VYVPRVQGAEVAALDYKTARGLAGGAAAVALAFQARRQALGAASLYHSAGSVPPKPAQGLRALAGAAGALRGDGGNAPPLAVLAAGRHQLRNFLSCL
jgi:hypothetical protein